MVPRRLSSILASLLLLAGGRALGQHAPLRSSGPPASGPAARPSAPDGSCPPGNILFTQSSSQTIEAMNGVTCALLPPSPPYHLATSWWRSFRLEDYGLLGPVQLCQLELGVEQATTPGAVGQPITFNVGVSLGAPFPLGFRYVLGTVSTTVPDMVNQIFAVPTTILVPAGSEVFVEVQIPDGSSGQQFFFPGGNTQAESGPTYFSSPPEACDFPDPVTMEELGFPDSHLIINFRGIEVPIAPTALELEGDPNFVLEVGEAPTLGTEWTSFFPAPQDASSTSASIHASGSLTKGLPDPNAGYGTLAPATPKSCVETGDCVELTTGGTKTFGVDEDLFVAETLVLPPAPAGAYPHKIWDIHVGGSFADVPSTNIFYRYIETLLHHDVTAGCGGGNYCPGQSTTRQQMSVFVLRAKEGPGFIPPVCEPPNLFADVPEGSPFCRWIEELANRGVVAGCGGGNYCPNNPVTREQMAVFVLKTLEPSFTPPACTNNTIFLDVPETSPFCRWIEELARRGVVAGCGGGNYCPTSPVTRQQMGVFLSLTFGLSLYGP